MSRDKKILFCLVICIAILLTALGLQAIKIEEIEAADIEDDAAPITRGAFTLFQYTAVGWTNCEYLTEYYIKDGLLYYKTKEGLKNFSDMSSFKMVEGWIEGESKINYGFYTWDTDYDFD
ncbi:hypothetical protein [Lutispora sp.]|uniref:hypothetical protein n=1 Tax=Lutispora sp. TaxID=2828727 RepID=UPI002B2185BD|nr:hypothetical protein [Lutispora sp.]MEA4960372.1 hypothetical protein [Lutispora sp.]